MRAIVGRIESEIDGVDILVNNVGIGSNRCPIEEVTPEMFARSMAIHARETLFATQAVVPGMKARRFGRIVNISWSTMPGDGTTRNFRAWRRPTGPGTRLNARSVLNVTRAFMTMMVEWRYGCIVNVCSVDAYEGRPSIACYAAAKAAVLSLTRSFALELAPHDVLVNAVSPGPIATDVAKSQDWLNARLPLISLGRVAEPEDIAAIVLFLASARNRVIVGEGVMANGGLLMA